MGKVRKLTIAILAFSVFISGCINNTKNAKEDHGLSLMLHTNAHEGPVVVPSQGRLYYTTKPDFSASDTHILIRYLDLANNTVSTFRPRSNMANGMWLSRDGKALLVAEQGSFDSRGAISLITLTDGKREVLVDEYQNKPLNSPNKVIESSSGWIYFSDPDYGHNQGFKPPPQLPMAIYAHDLLTGKTVRLSKEFVRPHGLALSPDENILYVGDTDAIDGKNSYDPKRTHEILKAKLSAPDRLNSIEHLITVPVGIPDGFVTSPNGELFVAAGDGVRHYSSSGELLDLMAIPNGAVNLTLSDGILYITADTAIYRATIEH